MKKYKIGYTQGVYDLFHVGHLNLLNLAKKDCDKLVVGVNSDDLVMKYKNHAPHISDSMRLEIIKNIKAVDHAFLTDSLDKEKIWQQTHFDAIFIGDDWKGNERWIATEKALKPYGVDVVYLPYTKGISSTKIRKSLQEKETGIKYSVITPVFNSYKFMNFFFKTVEENKKRRDIEFILIDDCSTDRTYEQLEQYINDSEANLKLFKTNENGGPGGARNLGIKKSVGKWIVFLDSDDGLCVDFFEKLDRVSADDRIDCIIYDSLVYDKNNKVVQRASSMYGKGAGKITAEEAIAFSIPGIRKCVKRTAICDNAIYFPHFMRAEDFAFYTMLFSHTPGIVIEYVKEPLYFIHQRAGSLSHNGIKENVFPEVYAYLYKNTDKSLHFAIQISSIRLLLYGGVLLLTENRAANGELRKYIDEYERNYPDWYQSNGRKILSRSKKVFLFCVKYRLFIMIRLYVMLHKKMTTR